MFPWYLSFGILFVFLDFPCTLLFGALFYALDSHGIYIFYIPAPPRNFADTSLYDIQHLIFDFPQFSFWLCFMDSFLSSYFFSTTCFFRSFFNEHLALTVKSTFINCISKTGSNFKRTAVPELDTLPFSFLLCKSNRYMELFPEIKSKLLF